MLVGFLFSLLLLVALLAIPITIAFQVNSKQSVKSSFTLVWLFGLVNIKSRERNSKKTLNNKSAHNSVQDNDKPRNKERRQYAFRLIIQPELRQYILSFVPRVLRAITSNDVQVTIRIGLDNPADTGVLWGYMGPVAGWLGSLRNVSIGLVPEFSQAIFEFNGEGRLRFIPIQFIYLLIALVLSPVVLKSFMRARSRRLPT